MTKKEQQQIYVSPYMATMDIETQAIICVSGNGTQQYENETPDWF